MTIRREALSLYKFTGFTEKANIALNKAMETAENMGHTYVGSEHLLTGLSYDVGGVSGTVLLSRGVTTQMLEELLKKSVGIGAPTVLSPDDFTPRSKRIVEISITQSRAAGLRFVGTEYLLSALLHESNSFAVHFLTQLGVAPSDLLNDLNRVLGGVTVSSKGGKRTSDSKTTTLEQYGRDLTLLAEQGKIDPVIGREKETERVIQILSRRNKNNPCLIGEPGVGKTAVAEGLALLIAQNEAPETLVNKKIFTLDLNGMVAGTKYRGDFEDRIKTCVEEVQKAGDIILFIDEMHTLIGAGAAEGAVDAANILKPSLARGDLQVIGATTLDEYRRHIEKDAALERRFQPVFVGEPTQEEALCILRGLRDKYEAHHKVRITDEALEAAVKMSAQYISDRFLPDKAIDLIDEASARVHLRSFNAPPDLKQTEEQLREIEAEKTAAIHAQDFERAARMRDEERELRSKFTEQRSEWQERSAGDVGEVTRQEVAEIVALWTGIPAAKITQEESERLLNLENELHRRVVGQDEAVKAVARAVRRSRAGLKDPRRPVGSFFFLGPSGVGKTELCKTLAESLFGDENAMIRFDMSEYMEKHTSSRLVGSPPGYVGYDEGGQLTQKVRQKPYSVLLFDEIEKAHPDIFNILLQVLEDGILTDSQGRRVDFKNCILIMTSNVGAREISSGGTGLGFKGVSGEAGREEHIKKSVMSELKRTFRPEFLNRVDETVIFRPLGKAEIEEIVRRMLSELVERLKELNIEMTFSDDVILKIAEEGFDEVYGARPLRRAVRSKIEDPLSELLLEKRLKSGEKYECTAENGEIAFNINSN